jgi:hypothetical protein
VSYSESDAKQALMNKVERVVGYVPVGMDDILSILIGPDVYPEFKEYLRKHEESYNER